MSDDLVLMPEVYARRALAGRPIRLQTLVPYGSWIGCGALRVLRVKIEEDGSADVTAGYESYRSP
ncbi:MAG: hypothetical protein JO190_05900 [Candidatus Eremiobacteraeota bacterium]|nr:hypothetical protein [Candidatus Eremiobacteraeota bacterium]MBV8499238.1 hypothetical protein [Candidatus Eremiobacteraeota bacterium]